VSQSWRHGARILLVLATIFAVTMAVLPHPPSVPVSNDKIQHMLAFGVLTILSARGEGTRIDIVVAYGTVGATMAV
jgi:hypothetical protein